MKTRRKRTHMMQAVSQAPGNLNSYLESFDSITNYIPPLFKDGRSDINVIISAATVTYFYRALERHGT